MNVLSMIGISVLNLFEGSIIAMFKALKIKLFFFLAKYSPLY